MNFNIHLLLTKKDFRDNFYKNLVWIVDGLRRKRDKDQFFKALKDGVQVIASPVLIKVYSDESRLVQEWKDSNVPVFLTLEKLRESGG